MKPTRRKRKAQRERAERARIGSRFVCGEDDGGLIYASQRCKVCNHTPCPFCTGPLWCDVIVDAEAEEVEFCCNERCTFSGKVEFTRRDGSPW